MADNIKLNLIVPMGGGRDIMSKEEFLKVLPKFQEMLSSLSRVYPGRIISDLPPALDDMRTVISACRAESLISILPDNAISLCGIGILHPELKVGDIRKDDIVEVWKKKKLFLDIRSLSRHNVKGVCKYCIFFKHCRTCCPAAVYDYYGTFFHSNPLCQWLWEEGLFPAKFLIQEHKLGV